MLAKPANQQYQRRDITRWTIIRKTGENKRPVQLFWSATEEDFENPDEFVAKQITQLETETFPQLSDRWQFIGTTTAHKQIFVKHAVPIDTLETPDELHIALTDTMTPSEKDVLPGVRFRRTGTDAVEVIALQQSIVDNLKRQGAEIAFDLIKKGYTVANIKQHIRDLIAQKYTGLFEDWFTEPNFFTLEDEAFKERVTEIRKTYSQRKRLMHKLNWYGDAPPGQFTSFVIACKLFSEQGITKISLPQSLPWQAAQLDKRRKEGKATDSFDRILQNLAKVGHAATQDIDGVTIEEIHPNGYIHLRLADHLSSNQPFLSDLLQVSLH